MSHTGGVWAASLSLSPISCLPAHSLALVHTLPLLPLAALRAPLVSSPVWPGPAPIPGFVPPPPLSGSRFPDMQAGVGLLVVGASLPDAHHACSFIRARVLTHCFQRVRQ